MNLLMKKLLQLRMMYITQEKTSYLVDGFILITIQIRSSYDLMKIHQVLNQHYMADTMKKQYRGLMAQNATMNYFSAITFFFISPEGDILIHEKEWEPVKEKILETFKNMKPLNTKKKKH